MIQLTTFFEQRNQELLEKKFLDDFQKITMGKDDKTVPISLRVPRNILDVFKYNSQKKKLKYQSVIVELMRNWIINQKSNT